MPFCHPPAYFFSQVNFYHAAKVTACGERKTSGLARQFVPVNRVGSIIDNLTFAVNF
jgi:hypothetical protein